MQQYSITQPTTRIIPASREPANISSEATILGICIIALPILAAVSAIIYKQYRTVTLRRQIAILERIWHLHSPEKMY